MNLNEIIPDHDTLRIPTIVDHLVRHFGIHPHARDLTLVLGDGTSTCPREALRHWVMAQCRELAGEDLEFPLRTIEYRLAECLEAHGYDLADLALPSTAAQRLKTRLPDHDHKLTIARRLRAVSSEPDPYRQK